jgi:hypothetical protein
LRSSQSAANGRIAVIVPREVVYES